jgi:hypothetical protein
MSEIVNLRQFKKAKARASREKEAEQNRVLFGRTKAERSLAQAENRKAENFLANSKLESRDKPDDNT